MIPGVALIIGLLLIWFGRSLILLYFNWDAFRKSQPQPFAYHVALIVTSIGGAIALVSVCFLIQFIWERLS